MKLWHIGIMVVNDNDPLEENIPSVGAPVTEGGLYDCQIRGDDRINPRKLVNHYRSGPKLPSVIPSIVTDLTLQDYLLILFPLDYVKDTMLPRTNRRLSEVDPHASEHEFIKG